MEKQILRNYVTFVFGFSLISIIWKIVSQFVVKILYWLAPDLSVIDCLVKIKNILQSLMFIIIRLVMNIFIVLIIKS